MRERFVKRLKKLGVFFDTPLKRGILYFLIALSAAWFHNLENQDELWNYTFANCIANGLYPYRDFNLLQTPLSCLINAVAVIVFGHHLLVIRMMGALLFTAISCVIDSLSVKLGAESVYVSFIPSVFLCMFFWNVFLEYSCLIMLFSLCLISFDIDIYNGEKKNVPRQLAAGALAGCAMMCKQTFGTFIALASVISIILVSLTGGVRVSKKDILTRVFYRLLGMSVPCFIFLFWLLATNTFGDFWDMCFKGISTFSSSYSYIAFMKENPAYFFLGALLPALLLLAIYRIIRCRGDRKSGLSSIVLLYSLFGCINMYPMANSYHVMTCSIPILLLLFTVLPDKLLKKSWLKGLSLITSVGVACFIFIVNPIDDAIHFDLTTDIRGLEFTFMDEELHDEIKTVDSYIRGLNDKGTTVYILDNFAPRYFIPSNQYHKYLDMFLVGNLGTKSPEECLAEAEADAVFLIPDKSRGQFQYPYDAVNEFLKEHAKIGTLCSYTLYK